MGQTSRAAQCPDGYLEPLKNSWENLGDSGCKPFPLNWFTSLSLQFRFYRLWIIESRTPSSLRCTTVLEVTRKESANSMRAHHPLVGTPQLQRARREAAWNLTLKYGDSVTSPSTRLGRREFLSPGGDANFLCPPSCVRAWRQETRIT